MDDFEEADNAYAGKVMALQAQLKEIENEHRHALLSLDSKAKENQTHLHSIQNALVE